TRAALASCAAARSQLAQQMRALLLVGAEKVGPPRAAVAEGFTCLFAQQQEVVAGAQARMFKQVLDAPGIAARQAPLQFPYFAHGLTETARDSGMSLLPIQGDVDCLLYRQRFGDSLGGDGRELLLQCGPQQGGIKIGRASWR